jgi:hypothetical protein
MGGNLNSALAGAVSGALFGAAGAMTTPTSFASYAAHAAAGCASAAASGGSCGSGAAGAVVGKLFTNLTVASLGQSSPGAHFAGAVIGGGMGSLAAGGRFQDGAFSAGLGYLFNECGHGGCFNRKEESGTFFGLKLTAADLPPIPQGVADAVTGFGDGAYKAITLGIGDLKDVRGVMGVDGGIDPASAAYRISFGGGAVVGGVALGGAAGITLNEGMWGRGALSIMNENRYLRIGYGKGPEFSLVVRAAGQWIDKITGTARSHIDLIKFNRPYK